MPKHGMELDPEQTTLKTWNGTKEVTRVKYNCSNSPNTEAREDIYLSLRSGAEVAEGHILHTNQLSNSNPLFYTNLCSFPLPFWFQFRSRFYR